MQITLIDEEEASTTTQLIIIYELPPAIWVPVIEEEAAPQIKTEDDTTPISTLEAELTPLSHFGEFSVLFSEPVASTEDLESVLSLEIAPFQDWHLELEGFNPLLLEFTWNITSASPMNVSF